jgi:broad-specificity NMP kinase
MIRKVRTSSDIESAALEAIENAIRNGQIDTRGQERESVVERLYMVLNQYEEENNELRAKLQSASEQISLLRKQLDELKQHIII